MPERSVPFLPYGRQSVDDADIDAVVKVLRSPYLTTGPAVSTFEANFAKAVSAKYAVSCSNGTAALHLAALALGLGPSDVAIVPSMTFLATANAARFVGAEVQFADVDPDTGLLTAAALEAALAAAGPRAKAVFPVHLNGQSCDMAAFEALARPRNIALAEDACHALGGSGLGRCDHSQMAVFSLHPVKTITAGEGGVVATNDDILAERLARLRNHGMIREPARFSQRDQAFDQDGGANPWYYEMPEVGFNYRLPDINAALADSQLARLPAFAARRKKLSHRYDTLLAPLAPVVRPLARVSGQDAVLHLYAARIDFPSIGTTRAKVMHELREKGVGTQVHYLPVHRQPYYRERYGNLHLPGADAYYEKALSLPLFPAMTSGDVDFVVSALKSVIGMAH